MKRRSFLFAIILTPALAFAEQQAAPAQVFTQAAQALVGIYSPAKAAEPRSVHKGEDCVHNPKG